MPKPRECDPRPDKLITPGPRQRFSFFDFEPMQLSQSTTGGGCSSRRGSDLGEPVQSLPEQREDRSTTYRGP
jgi:hypothetical protein